jgi:phosphate transport system substrate-binding protein
MNASSFSFRYLRRISFVALLVLVVGVIAAGCGGESSDSGETQMIRIDGSSTVYPVTEAVAEEFMEANPRLRVTVGISGTGGGFSKFVRGETDVSNASRPILPAEIQLAEQNNIQYIELPVAYDGLSVIVHAENDWADCLTVEELRRIWETGSEIDNWREVRDSFPDRPLKLYGAGTDSGTYDYFTAAIMGETGDSRATFTASEDDNVLVQGVAGDPNSLGFLGLAYYESNQNKLKLLGVDDGNPDNGEGCVKPTVETVNTGRYQPLARPEFIYVRADRAESESVQEFVRFYMENGSELAREVGYVPLSDKAYDLAIQRFEERVTGTMFSGKESTVGVRMEEIMQQARDAQARDQAREVDTTAPSDTTVTDR